MYTFYRLHDTFELLQEGAPEPNPGTMWSAVGDAESHVTGSDGTSVLLHPRVRKQSETIRVSVEVINYLKKNMFKQN